jgi:hypothetical protein
VNARIGERRAQVLGPQCDAEAGNARANRHRGGRLTSTPAIDRLKKLADPAQANTSSSTVSLCAGEVIHPPKPEGPAPGRGGSRPQHRAREVLINDPADGQAQLGRGRGRQSP